MYVDIVEVIKTVHTHWAADILVMSGPLSTDFPSSPTRQCGIPLKTKDNPRAKYTVNEVFDMFGDLVRDCEDFRCLVLTSFVVHASPSTLLHYSLLTLNPQGLFPWSR